MPSRRPIHRLALAALVALAIGCQYNPELRIREHDRFTPSGRGSWEIYPGIARRRPGTLVDLVTGPKEEEAAGQAVTARSAGVRGTISIDSEIAGVDAKDHQQVAVGEQVELGPLVVPGPARVTVKTENLRGYVAARGGIRLFDVLSLELITGVGFDRTRVRLRDGGTGAGDPDLKGALVLGWRATVRPIPLFDVYAQQVSYVVNDTLSSDAKPFQDREVGLDLNVTRNVSLFAGYRWWQYQADHALKSDVDVRISGPTAGLSLRF